MMEKEKYFNFPIQLLQGFILDDKKVLNNILDYAVYAHAKKLEYGNDTKMISDSASYFGITLGNAIKTKKNGKILFDSIPEKSPMAGIGKTMFFEFYKNEKSEFEKVCLLGYLAIRSILGNKESTKTNNKLWLGRIDGQPKAVKDYFELSDEINKYANEYQTNKIKTELRNNWGLITYSRFTRGFYVSYSFAGT